MSNNKHYTEKFKIEVVRQVTERGFAVREVAARLGVSTWSLYQWAKRYGVTADKVPGLMSDLEKFIQDQPRKSEEASAGRAGGCQPSRGKYRQDCYARGL